MTRRMPLIAILLAAGVASGCGGDAPPPASTAKADWSAFNGSHQPVDPRSVRVVPATPTEITGVPYVRAIRLAWTDSTEVPSFDAENESLHFPDRARQAVLLVNVGEVPDDTSIRVEWYYNDSIAFTDELASRDEGDHFFALIKEEARGLAPLPRGAYRSDVLDGTRLIKSIRFSVSGDVK
jgi:hypothetical protein